MKGISGTRHWHCAEKGEAGGRCGEEEGRRPIPIQVQWIPHPDAASGVVQLAEYDDHQEEAVAEVLVDESRSSTPDWHWRAPCAVDGSIVSNRRDDNEL
jgi:hypothetical protein